MLPRYVCSSVIQEFALINRRFHKTYQQSADLYQLSLLVFLVLKKFFHVTLTSRLLIPADFSRHF